MYLLSYSKDCGCYGEVHGLVDTVEESDVEAALPDNRSQPGAREHHVSTTGTNTTRAHMKLSSFIPSSLTFHITLNVNVDYDHFSYCGIILGCSYNNL